MLQLVYLVLVFWALPPVAPPSNPPTILFFGESMPAIEQRGGVFYWDGLEVVDKEVAKKLAQLVESRRVKL